MPLHLIQLTDKEWMDWQAVISIAHLLSANLKAGSYKGAIGDSPAAKALRSDLTALVKASDKIEKNTDVLDPEPSTEALKEMPEANNRGARRGRYAAKAPAATAASTEAETESSPETTEEPDNDPRDNEEDTGA